MKFTISENSSPNTGTAQGTSTIIKLFHSRKYSLERPHSLTHFVTLHCSFSVDNYRACIYNLSDDKVLLNIERHAASGWCSVQSNWELKRKCYPFSPLPLSSWVLNWAAQSHSADRVIKNPILHGMDEQLDVGRTNQIKNVQKYESMFTLVTSLIRNKEGSSVSALLSILNTTRYKWKHYEVCNILSYFMSGSLYTWIRSWAMWHQDNL